MAKKTAVQEDTVSVPLQIGGMDSAGDPTLIGDGATRYLHNMLLRPNRCESRPPATYDNLMSIRGLVTFEDNVNKVQRLLAIDGALGFYEKATSGETWSAKLGSLSGTQRVTDSANYRGKTYIATDNGAGVPSTPMLFTSTTPLQSVYGPTGYANVLRSLTVTPYGERLFLCYPRVSFIASSPTGTATGSYDFTDVTWTKTAITAKNLTFGSSITCRLFPTSLAASACFVLDSTGIPSNSTVARPYNVAFDIKPVDASNTVPITVEIIVLRSWTSTTFAVGDVVSGTSGGVVYLFQATVGGISGGVEPAWLAVKGGTQADGAVTWLNIGTNIVAAEEFTIPTATDSQDFQAYYATGNVPASTNIIFATARLKLFNTQKTALTVLTPIDVAFRDGLTDGDPLKANHGYHSIQLGEHLLPFYNQESSLTASFDLDADIVWSETLQPTRILASNTFKLVEIAGNPTAAKSIGGRLVVYKRRAFWVFNLTDDPDIPILPEGPVRVGNGALGPRAIDTLDDEVFWIGETEAWRMRIGSQPRPLCGGAMKEEILDRTSSSWVESQSTYNMPLLTIDRKNREVWLYTQKGKLYCYHLGDEDTPGVFQPAKGEVGQWSVHDIQDQQVAAMVYSDTTQQLYIALGGQGLVRFDPTVTAKDSIDNTATTYSVTKDITFRPIELFAPRYDALCEGAGFYHTATATQTSNTLTLSISQDRGQTYAYTNVVRFDPTVARIPMAVWESGPSLTLKLTHSGSAGKAAWGISKAEAELQILRGEYPSVQATQISNTL